MEKYLEVLSNPNRPKIGIVVSTGGIKPFCAIELFDFFEKANIPIDLLVGCSGGAITCALKAIGLTAAQMREKVYSFVRKDVFQVDYKTIASILKIPFFAFKRGQALFKNERILEIFKNVFGEHTKIEDLSIPLIFQSTNIDTGEAHIITQGNLGKSAYSSSALQPFLPPINIDGQWLVDGYYSSSVPLLQAVRRGMDIIIVIDVQTKAAYFKRFANKGNNFLDFFNNFYLMTLSNSTSFQNSLAIGMHHHEIIYIDIPFYEAINMWDTDKLPMIFQVGKEAVDKVKTQIIEAIENFNK